MQDWMQQLVEPLLAEGFASEFPVIKNQSPHFLFLCPNILFTTHGVIDS